MKAFIFIRDVRDYYIYKEYLKGKRRKKKR
jgi:hypothetical protein